MKYNLWFLISFLLMAFTLGVRAEEQLTQNPDPQCNEAGGPVSAEDAPNYQHFKELAAKGSQAQLSDFLQYWYPNHYSDKEVKSYFDDCETSEWGAFRAFPDSSPLNKASDCKPDVLYSWGPAYKLDNFKKEMIDGGEWSGGLNQPKGSVWGTVSPSTTFTYGPVQVRFKLKPNLNYANVTYIQNDKMIFLESPKLDDFIMRNSAFIESWSYGTAEQYDEIVAEIKHIISLKRAHTYILGVPDDVAEIELKQKYGSGSDEDDSSDTDKAAKDFARGLNRYIHKVISENSPSSEATLKSTLLNMIHMIINKDNGIFYSNGACRNRADFFKTTRPTYFKQH